MVNIEFDSDANDGATCVFCMYKTGNIDNKNDGSVDRIINYPLVQFSPSPFFFHFKRAFITWEIIFCCWCYAAATGQISWQSFNSIIFRLFCCHHLFLSYFLRFINKNFAANYLQSAICDVLLGTFFQFKQVCVANWMWGAFYKCVL